MFIERHDLWMEPTANKKKIVEKPIYFLLFTLTLTFLFGVGFKSANISHTYIASLTLCALAKYLCKWANRMTKNRKKTKKIEFLFCKAQNNKLQQQKHKQKFWSHINTHCFSFFLHCFLLYFTVCSHLKCCQSIVIAYVYIMYSLFA